MVIFMGSSMILLSFSGLVGRYILKSLVVLIDSFVLALVLLGLYDFTSSRFFHTLAVSRYKLFVYGRLCWSRILLCGDSDSELIRRVKYYLWNYNWFINYQRIRMHEFNFSLTSMKICISSWLLWKCVILKGSLFYVEIMKAAR